LAPRPVQVPLAACALPAASASKADSRVAPRANGEEIRPGGAWRMDDGLLLFIGLLMETILEFGLDGCNSALTVLQIAALVQPCAIFSDAQPFFSFIFGK